MLDRNACRVARTKQNELWLTPVFIASCGEKSRSHLHFSVRVVVRLWSVWRANRGFQEVHQGVATALVPSNAMLS